MENQDLLEKLLGKLTVGNDSISRIGLAQPEAYSWGQILSGFSATASSLRFCAETIAPALATQTVTPWEVPPARDYYAIAAQLLAPAQSSGVLEALQDAKEKFEKDGDDAEALQRFAAMVKRATTQRNKTLLELAQPLADEAEKKVEYDQKKVQPTFVGGELRTMRDAQNARATVSSVLSKLYSGTTRDFGTVHEQ